jgi:hypothetical protein
MKSNKYIIKIKQIKWNKQNKRD